MRNAWNHPNDPSRDYDFYDDTKDNFLYYLADDDGPLVPGNWGNIVVLLFARGCLKTTVASAAAEWAVAEYPFVEVDVTAPRQDQFTEVMDRFKEHIKHSGLDALRSKNNISHQKFERILERDNGEEVPVEADVKARSAWNAGDALRGLHGHLGIIDEFQDVDEGMFSNFLEVVDQGVPQVGYFPTIIVIGTPKMANDFFNDLWEMSDQKTWDPDAEAPDDADRENGAWVKQSSTQEFMPSDLRERRAELEDEIEDLEAYPESNDLSDDEREPIEAELASKREAAEEIGGYTVTGWHIDQYASPLHDNTKIEFKKNKYTPREFQNEVLANFYTPENDLLTDEHVRERFIPDKGFENRRVYDDSTVVMGVDWGGGDGKNASDTVIVVGERVDHDDEHTIIIRDVSFIDPGMTKQQELEEVEQRIRDFQVDRVAVDEGYGAKQREDLQDGNNIWRESGWDNVCGVIYGNIKDKGQPTFSDSNFEDSRYCTVARTHMIENMVAEVKDGKIDIPSKDLSFDRDGDGTKLQDQLTAPYTDRVETSDRKRKKKVLADRNDDAFQAFTYMWIASAKFGSTRTLKNIATHSRAGN